MRHHFAKALAVLPLLSTGLRAATVQHAGTIVDDAGAQVTEWRTASTLKSRDTDGDQIYGTTAWILHGLGSSGENTVFQLDGADPVVGPFSGYATVDDPAGGADVVVRTTTNHGTPAQDDVMLTFTARAGMPPNVRVGIATDGLDFASVAPASIGLRQVGGASAEWTLAAGNRILDMVFFDLTGVREGDQFEIFADTGSGGYSTHQLVTWDVIPPLVVNTLADELDTPSGATLSLREALRDATLTDHPDTITFHSSLNGRAIELTSHSDYGGETALIVFDQSGVTVDAANLPAGLAITRPQGSAGDNYRAIGLAPGARMNLRGLILHGFRAQAGTRGGAILNGGALALENCTLTGNSAPGNGGAISSDGTLALLHCTLSGNSATGGSGGAIHNFISGTATITHCTLSANTAQGGGGGIRQEGGAITLNHTIVAGNAAVAAGPDIHDTVPAIVTTGVNLIGNNSGSGLVAGPGLLVNADHRLAALAFYGGNTPTMPPREGSPAIDPGSGSSTSPHAVDQRGFPRVADGDATPGGTADIGAVEYSFSAPTNAVVITIADAGLGSLRATLAAMESQPGADLITFAPALNGQTIELSSSSVSNPHGRSAIEVRDADGVTIDASALPAGLAISDGLATTHRLFIVQPGARLGLTGLTLANGGGAGVNYGGAIMNNEGTVTIRNCTLDASSAALAGAILNYGSLSILSSSIINSQAGDVGAIYHITGSAEMTQCTLSGNTSGGSGGAVLSKSTLRLTHCTIAGNSAPVGGGLHVLAGTTSTLNNTLVAGNTATQGASSGPDVWNEGLLDREGVSIVQALGGNGSIGGSGQILVVASPLHALGNYGGRTVTRPPLPGSPAVDGVPSGSAVPGIATDQRGVALRDGDGNGSVLPDIGAAEANTPLVVTTTADAGPGSLRATIAAAQGQAGPDLITFAPGLSGGTIVLSSFSSIDNLGNSALHVADAQGITIDGSALSAPVALSGGFAPTHRLLRIQPNARLELRGIQIRDAALPIGREGAGVINQGSLIMSRCTVTACTNSFVGGAIYNTGNLDATETTFSSSRSRFGGAIFNAGPAFFERCTFVGNQGEVGGAIHAQGSLRMSNCTLSANAGTSRGGAIEFDGFGSMVLTHCTLAGNTSPAGGGIFVIPGTTLTIRNTLIAGNTDPSNSSLPRNVANAGTILLAGVNIVQEIAGNTNVGGTGRMLAVACPVAPLGNYGGPTQTRPPLPGTPAIDGVTTGNEVAGLTEDQRGAGFLRSRDNDGDGTANPDIGAVESGNPIPALTVTTTTDENDGLAAGGISLREAVAFAPSGSTIVFAPSISGGTHRLTGEIVPVTDITVDGGAFGATLDGLNGTGRHRILSVNTGRSVVLRNLILTNGSGAGVLDDGFGGAVLNHGSLACEGCTLNANSGAKGGAIFNGAGAGLNLLRCTLSGNGDQAATSSGGAVQNHGSAAIVHCTLSGNRAADQSGVHNASGSNLTLAYTIIGGNSSAVEKILHDGAMLNLVGANLVQFPLAGTGTVGGSGSVAMAVPQLAPLDNYGGPTPTRALLQTSPARNAAVGSTATADQRGFPLVGVPDIGAYEGGTPSNYKAFIWENLPSLGDGTVSDALHQTGFDYDHDGQSNLSEWIALTDPANANSRHRITGLSTDGPSVRVTFPTASGRTYTVETSEDLVNWSAAAPVAGTGSLMQATVPFVATQPNRFIKVNVTLPPPGP